MQPVPHVLVQIALLVGVTAGAVAARGDAIGTALLVVLACGDAVALAFGLAYHVRRRGRLRAGHAISRTRLREDRQMAALCAIGLGGPTTLAVLLVTALSFDGLLFDSQASTVAALMPVVLLTAVVASSAVDWYLVRPFQCGVLDVPLCARGDGAPDRQRRRAYAKWWIVHRGICELLGYTSVALLIAIVAAALAERVGDDTVLKVAVGSFAGAGTAVALVTYLIPRTIACWEYTQIQSAGLGSWAEGVDARGRPVEGFVRDVSVKPGIQLCPTPQAGDFVPLEEVESAQEIDDPLDAFCPDGCCGWIEHCDRGRQEREAAAAMPAQPATAA